MIIGILSDTHDRDDAMAAGLKILRDRGAQFFAHCGDIGTQGCIDLLAGLPCAFVFGNTDWDRAGLARYAASIEVACYGNFASLELDGKRIAIMHGDDHRLKQQVLSAQEHDYLLLGHTHVKQDQRVGKTRVINPGALHRAAQKTVATLDTAADSLEFLNVTHLESRHMTPNDTIAHALSTSQKLLRRYIDDLTPAEYLHRPAPMANCTAWTIGHLILTERNLLRRLGQTDLPALPDDQFEKRFSRDEGCPQAGDFGDVSGLAALFDVHRNRAIELVRHAPAELLDKPLDKPHPMFATVGEYANFLAAHVAIHAGQITIIRRSLGRPLLV